MLSSLFSGFTEQWEKLSARDQLAMKCLAAAVAVSVLFFGIFLPIRNAHSGALAALNQAETVYDELLILAPQALGNSSSVSAVDPASINSEVRRQAARFGVTIQRFEPDGDRLQIWVEEVRYPAVIQWLGSLEDSGIIHAELTLEDTSNPGFVSARVTFTVM